MRRLLATIGAAVTLGALAVTTSTFGQAALAGITMTGLD
jgi:hypothetical protein